MKYKFWDTENNTWFKPVYELTKGNIQELLITQSGELCLRKMEKGELNFLHESDLTTTIKNKSGEDEKAPRFVKCVYTGSRDAEGAKLFQNDIVKDPDGKYHLIDFGLFDEKFGFGRVAGHYIPSGCEKVGNKFENPELLPKERGNDE